MFWKGRVGLYTLFKALRLSSGDEVILPGFTCVVVANAVLYTGARPIYADIDPQTYNITAETVAPLITPKTRVIIVQNTFGLSPDYDPMMTLAEKHGIFIIEDCAHGLGGAYKNKPAGVIAHATFFSTQWSKPISTGLGGILLVREAELAQKVARLYSKTPKPSLLAQLSLLAQVLVRPLANHPALHYRLVDSYRFLTQKAGLSVGSSVGDELSSTKMPIDYALRMGFFQEIGWNTGLKKLELRTQKRQRSAQYYDDYFANTSYQPPFRPKYSKHSWLRYVIRVPEKQQFLIKARQMHIPVGDWFVSPLHPVEKDLELWHYRSGQCPESETACNELINLSTSQLLSVSQLDQLFG